MKCGDDEDWGARLVEIAVQKCSGRRKEEEKKKKKKKKKKIEVYREILMV